MPASSEVAVRPAKVTLPRSGRWALYCCRAAVTARSKVGVPAEKVSSTYVQRAPWPGRRYTVSKAALWMMPGMVRYRVWVEMWK